MEQTDEEVLVVEQPPLLPGDVEFGKLQAEFVVNVLPREEGGAQQEWNQIFTPNRSNTPTLMQLIHKYPYIKTSNCTNH